MEKEVTKGRQTALSKATKKSHRLKYENEAAARSALIEFCIYMCFLAVTILVAASSRNLSMYFFNDTIDNLFVDRDVNAPVYEVDLEFENLATLDDLWEFLQSKCIPDLHGEENDDDAVESEQTNQRRRRAPEEELIFLTQNVVLGPPRLRQIRVKADTCDVHEVFGRYFNKCYADYSKANEDTSAEFMGAKYKTLNELKALPYWGKITIYDSGGFVKDLTYDYEENQRIVADLKKRMWLDRASRLFMIEFTLFNANKNLMNNIKFVAELPPTGGVVPTYSIQSVKTSSVFWKDGIVVFVAGILFYLFIIYYTIIEILELHHMGVANYVRVIWNFVDFWIIALAYFTLIYNIWHPFYVNLLYKRVEEKPNEFLALDTFCFWNLMYRDMMAICAFLVCIKTFKFISFHSTVRHFYVTVSSCFRDLLGFGVMFIIVFLAYAELGLLLFGNEHNDFRNFYQSLLTMIRMILGDFNYETIERANRILGPIYFITYIFLVFFILLNMFLAIINDTYSTVKREVKGGRNYLLLYVSKLLHRWCPKCFRAQPQDETQPEDQAKPSHRKDDAPDNLEPIGQQKQQIQDANSAAITRLTARQVALEDVIAQMVTDVDRTMRKVLPRRRKRPSVRQETSSEPETREG
ncbi:polycystic kidney disease 2-like 1 protein [Anastrepha ludens]|uniref:polycystic kidney disease 2-like 1 protein n=1 Tax=Anastrepha ludens TaxID=28586 RepID=UPI0023AF09BD|nr:polycystic kidney disease 2-like 1 protein [Anastrepha ludens]